MKYIICLAHEPWLDVPTRTQQLLTRMKNVRILFFEPAGGKKDRSWKAAGRQVRPNITVYTLPPVSTMDERMGIFFRSGQDRQAKFIARKVDKHRARQALLWVTSPVYVHLLDRLSYDTLVYDCDRDWSEYPDHWESTLTRAAVVVFAASSALREVLLADNPNVATLPNGVHHSLFSQRTPSADQLLPEVRGPLFCWAGTIHADLDLSPLLHAAAEQPDWTFLLLGPVDKANRFLGRVRRMSNILLPGSCPLMEVPDYLYRSHVCIDLLRLHTPNAGVIPNRLYEYMSTGKPIVSMLRPEQVEPFPDVVYAAHDPEEFVRMCQQALDEDYNWVSGRRRGYGAGAAWSARAEQVAQILELGGLL